MEDYKLSEGGIDQIEHADADVSNGKRAASVTTTSSDLFTAEQQTQVKSTIGNAWQPSVFRIRPLLGLAALGGTIACLFAALAVLLVSRGQPQDSWPLQPTVYLAITTALSNTLLSCASALAAPISFWYKALRGSAIQDLELEWEASQGFVHAFARTIKQRRRVRLLTIASLAVAVVVIDGPLLQRASSVHFQKDSSHISLDFLIAPEVPTGFSGQYRNYLDLVVYNRAAWIADELTAKGFIDDKSIRSRTKCEGRCTTTIQGPGVAKSNCKKTTWPISENIMLNASSTWGTGYPWMPARPILSTNIHQASHPDSPNGPETVALAVGRANYNIWNGDFVLVECDLTSAILEYDIVLEGHSLQFPDPTALRSARVVAQANNTFLNFSSPEKQPATTNGLFEFVQAFIQTNVTLGSSNATTFPYIINSSENPMARKYITESHSSSTIIVGDPTDEIIGDANLFFLRAGIMAATWENATSLMDPGLSTTQRVRAVQTQHHNVFHSDLRWFAGAAALQILAVVLVLPIFWGWWRIGTPLSLSPFQLARLLDAAVFRSASHTESIWDMEEIRLRLGLIEDPTNRQSTGDRLDEAGITRRNSRIGVGELNSVTSPGASV